MSLVVFQHHRDEHPSRLGRILADHGHRLRVVHLYDGQPLPPDLDDVEGVVSMGGPMNVADTAEHDWIEPELAYLRQAYERGRPLVGVCLGAQLIARALGGKVGAMEQPEVGWHEVKLSFPGTMDILHQGIPWTTMQFHLHSQQITQLPPDAVALSGSEACRTQAFKLGMWTYGWQYHFEWDRSDIEHFARSDMVRQAGGDPDAIIKACDEHYARYRRLGDRLCKQIAELLIPVDKRGPRVTSIGTP